MKTTIKLNRVKQIVFFLFLFETCVLSFTYAQSAQQVYNYGSILRKDRNYETGYRNCLVLMRSDSVKPEYLSQVSYFHSKFGFHCRDEEKQLAMYQRACSLATRAIAREPGLADAHYSYALALGHLSTVSDLSVKLKNALIIKEESEKAIRLDPNHAGAYHMLGRWHAVIAGFSLIEKTALNCLTRGLANKADFQSATTCFLKAIALEPEYKMHRYALAEVYYEMDLHEMSKQYLDQVLKNENKNDDDKLAVVKAEELSKKLTIKLTAK